MELLLIPFAVLVAVFVISYSCLKNHGGQNLAPRLPPGRSGWPIIGESLDYYNNFKDSALDRFVSERMNKYSDKVFWTSLFGQPMAILCGAQGNKFLFSNENKLVKSWWPSGIEQIFPKPSGRSTKEEVYDLRKLLHSLLKADSVGKYVGAMDQTMKKSIETDWTKEGGIVRVSDAVKNYNVALACRVFIGIEDPLVHQTVGKLMAKVAKGFLTLPVNLPGTALNAAVKGSKELRTIIGEIIQKKKIEKHGGGGGDNAVLSHMLDAAAADTGKYMSDADVATHIASFIIAGYDTLTSTLTLVMKYLADYPHVYDQVYKEQMEIAQSRSSNALLTWEDARKMKYSWNVVCEVQRLRPPAAGGFKEAITDFTYEGFTIPKGWKMHWMAQVTHKDPQFFPNPDDFDPSRFEGTSPPPCTFIPFGAGPRMCPGNEYAKLVMLVFVHNVVTKFKWEPLDPCEKVMTDPVPRLTQGFPVRVRPHKP